MAGVVGIFKWERTEDCDCNAFRVPIRHTNTVLHEQGIST